MTEPTPKRGSSDSALIFLNHLSTNRLMWRPVMDEAARQGRTALAVERADAVHRMSREGLWSTADLAADAISIVDHAGVELADVCGTSLGGCLAQEIALGHPIETAR